MLETLRRQTGARQPLPVDVSNRYSRNFSFTFAIV